MTLVLCWLAFPLVLALLAGGLGLLAERAAGTRLPASLLLPAGFAVMVVVSTLSTLKGGTAPLTTPLLVLLSIAGFATLGLPGREWHPSRFGVLAVLAVLAVGAAPVVLSGTAGFAGYTQLDDISTFLAFAAHGIEHGRDVAGLPPSTFEATLAVNLDSGYPLGAFIPLAAAGKLVGQDIAWLWQPYMTFLLGLIALSLWALAGPLVRDPRLRAGVVFVAAQPALLYAYALQGGVKELAATALLAFAAAVGAALVRSPVRPRLAIPLGIAAVALLCVLNLGAVAYVAPLAVALAVAAIPAWRARKPRPPRPLRRRATVVGASLALALALAVPVVSATSSFVAGGSGLLHSPTDIGNLFHALDWRQLFGIWPSGDFRDGIGQGRPLALVLIVVVGAAAVGGAFWALRRRVPGPLVFAVAAVGALVGLATFGDSPWVNAKALAIASPSVMLLALLAACALLGERRLRVVGAVGLVAIAGGVVWSNWLAYRDVKLAPRDRLAELATIGNRFAGDGPTMINEYEPYGARYFLRRMDPEAPAELRRRVVPLRTGQGLGKDQWAPVDEFQRPAVLVYRTIVVRRSPAEARPPSDYGLRYSGRYYDVYQRPVTPTRRVLTYSIFGDQENAGALPPCALVGRLARVAASGRGSLVAAVRAPAVVADLSRASWPRGWGYAPGPPGMLYPSAPGSARIAGVSVPASGTYDVWEQGSFGRGVELSVDGRGVGSTSDERSFTGQWIRFGARDLGAGPHTIELRYPGGSVAPGTGQQPETLGPVALVPRTPRSELITVAPSSARSLCARPLDWLEVVMAR